MIDFYRYTDKELQTLLKSLTIVVDSAEKENSHITDYFEKKKIPYIIKSLDFTDYSCYLPANIELGIIRDTYLNCYIERKNSLNEISGNFADGRDRFESEFLRAKGNKVFLMIEETSGFEKIVNHQYATKYNEKSFMATLLTFGHRYDLDIHFVDKEYAGMFIYMQLYYFTREFLKT